MSLEIAGMSNPLKILGKLMQIEISLGPLLPLIKRSRTDLSLSKSGIKVTPRHNSNQVPIGARLELCRGTA